jgi:hypothetical protein
MMESPFRYRFLLADIPAITVPATPAISANAPPTMKLIRQSNAAIPANMATNPDRATTARAVRLLSFVGSFMHPFSWVSVIRREFRRSQVVADVALYRSLLHV